MVNPVPQDVDLVLTNVGVDFDAGNHVHPVGPSCLQSFLEALGGIVIGQGENGDSLLSRRRDEAPWRQQAI